MARVPYLKGLIPEDVIFWQSLDQPGQIAGSDAALVADENNDVNLTADSPAPTWGLLNTGENYINFSGANAPLKSSTGKNLLIKHLFVIASYAGASFANNAGLFSERTGANSLLVGQLGSTKFYDLGHSGLEYRKSGAVFPQNNMQAPMNGSVELLEWKLPAGYLADSVQIGHDRDLANRQWNGRFYGAIGFDRVLTNLEVERIRLYARLKTRNWIALGETLSFPSPQIIWDETTYSRMWQVPLDFDSITDEHTYEDETKSFNQTNIKPPRRWEVEMNDISWDVAMTLDAFWENVRKIRPFNFYDYRRGEFYTDVRVESYDRTHRGHESFKNACRFKLVKYGYAPSLPYELVDNEIPTVAILTPLADAVLQGEVTITATAADNVGIKRVEYYLARLVDEELENHGLGSSTDAPYDFLFDSADYEDGAWTISAYAVDTSDNYSLVDSVTVEIDNVPEPDEEDPTLPDNAFSLNGVPTVSVIPYKWLAGSDNVGVTGYRITYDDNEEFTSPSTKLFGNVLNGNVTGLPAETNIWAYVQARDLAGNWSLASNVIQAATAPAGTGGFGEGLADWDGDGVADWDGEGTFTE